MILLPGPHVETDFLLWLSYQAMDLFHILPLNRNESETVEEDRGENCHLKVGELVARALPRAVCAKGTELSSPASVGATGGKMVWVKPVESGKRKEWRVRKAGRRDSRRWVAEGRISIPVTSGKKH